MEEVGHRAASQETDPSVQREIFKTIRTLELTQPEVLRSVEQLKQSSTSPTVQRLASEILKSSLPSSPSPQKTSATALEGSWIPGATSQLETLQTLWQQTVRAAARPLSSLSRALEGGKEAAPQRGILEALEPLSSEAVRERAAREGAMRR